MYNESLMELLKQGLALQNDGFRSADTSSLRKLQ